MKHEKTSPEEFEKKERIKVVIWIVFLVCFLFFSLIFSLASVNYTKIHKNVYIQNVNVSGLSQEEAKEKLNKIYESKKLNQINLKHNDFEMQISYDQLGITKDVDSAVNTAYSVGRTGNILTNNYRIFFCTFFKKKIKIGINVDDTSINNVISDVESKLPDVTLESSYYIDEDKLIIKKGKDGVLVDKDKLKSEIIKNIEDFTNETAEIEIPTYDKKADDIDIEKIANEIKKDPQDAYISKDPLEVHIEENGVELAISLDEAKEIIKKSYEEDNKQDENSTADNNNTEAENLTSEETNSSKENETTEVSTDASEEADEIIIPLKITKPNVTVESLGNEAFANKLATYTTNYDSSNTNRNNNLVLAAKKLNGTIVKPGEEFSYNKTIGQRTIASGFKEAGAYAGGQVVLDVGGGICQLSSTLYNAALLTNLEITERHNHYFLTSYVPAGRDATVSWGSVDFKFKNNRKYPIKIVSKASDGVVEVSIYGIKQDDDKTVVIDSKVTSVIPKKVEYVSKSSGMQERYGEDGATSETYKTVMKNGVVLSKSLISQDTYNSLSQIIYK